MDGCLCSWSRVSLKRKVGDEVRDLLGQGRFLKALQIVEGTLIFALGEMGNCWRALGIRMPQLTRFFIIKTLLRYNSYTILKCTVQYTHRLYNHPYYLIQ